MSTFIFNNPVTVADPATFTDSVTFFKRPEGTDTFSKKLVAYDETGFGWILTPDLSGNIITPLQPNPTFYRDFVSYKTLNHGEGPNITFTRASSGSFFSSNAVLQVVGENQPRFDHDPETGASRGLLIEESRTNYIRNSQALGASAGSPGNSPTNWQITGSINDLTRTIAIGTTNGFRYVDIRYAGTPSADFLIDIDPESNTQIEASSGQIWTHSIYLALAAGTAPLNCLVGVAGNISNGTTVESSATDVISSLNGSLKRFAQTLTLADGTTTYVTPTLQVSAVSGTPIDFTFRIAAPQLERGSFSTSYIPTTTLSATRAADSAVVTPITSFYKETEGTLTTETQLFVYGTTFPSIANLSFASSDTNNVILAYDRANSRIIVSGTGISVASSGVALGTHKAGVALSTTSSRAAVNGTLIGGSDASVTMPVSPTHLYLGRKRTTDEPLNGYIRKVAYYPKRLPNALLQQLTT